MGLRSLSRPVICFQDILNGVDRLHLMLLHYLLEEEGDFCKFDRPGQEGIYRHFIRPIEDSRCSFSPLDGLIRQREAEESLRIRSGEGEGFVS